MAITSTTLSAAITSGQLTMAVASATGISYSTTAPVLLKIDDEFVEVTAALNGTTVPIGRGRQGSRAQAHGNGRTVYIGNPQDFIAAGDGYNAGRITKGASGLFLPNTTVTSLSTAGNLTWTAGQVLGGMIDRDTNGAGRTDTMPTAALLVAALPGATIGSTFDFFVRNTAGAANTLTVAAGTGGTTVGTMTVAQSNAKVFRVRFTATDPGNEAYSVYSMGTVVF